MTKQDRATRLAVLLYLTGIGLLLFLTWWIHWTLAVLAVAATLLVIAKDVYEAAKK